MDFRTNHYDLLAKRTIEALRKNNFTATYVKTANEARETALSLISADATIGVGGSWTVQQLGLPDELEHRGHTVFNHNKPGLSKEEATALRHKEINADVFLCSTNALTVDGKLVNVDGAGNRVASMIFGPKKTIIFVGVNKIVQNLDEAMGRIQLQAAPTNNLRLNMPNPCTQTGQCMNCQSPTRICNVTTIMNRRPSAADIHVILIGEELGF